MALPKLTKLELQIMETLWTQGACSVREIHQAFPERGRPAFTTVQTTIYRLESKKALRRTKRISNLAAVVPERGSRQPAEDAYNERDRLNGSL